MWQKIMIKIQGLPKVDVVHTFENQAKSHLEKSDDNRCLHSKAVIESKIVRAVHPDGIDSEGVNAIFISNHITVFVNLLVAAAAKNAERYAHEVVVEQAHVEPKEAH